MSRKIAISNRKTPSILFVTVVLTTRALQSYGEINLLTGGGPSSNKATTTIPYLIYGNNSPIHNNLGLKSASAVLLSHPAPRRTSMVW